jgi:ribonuclease D
VIVDSAQLDGWLERLRQAPWLALDTEADSLHAYPERLCLIQISIPGEDVLIDPLAGFSLKPLWAALDGRVLILHGADYDLRLLYRGHGFVPHTLFDTMWAARLLGHMEFGLVNLASRFLGVTLEKGPQTANWGRRPLTPRMENYARNDTRHLKPLTDLLTAELEAKGRLSWHQEVCARLVEECAQHRVVDPENDWRVKGSDRLDRRGLAVLRAIWDWREEEAVASGRPPYFILSHEKLVELATVAITNGNLEFSLPRHLTHRRRSGALSAIENGLALPPAAWPRIPQRRGKRLTTVQKRRYEDLRERRDRRAVELGLDPSLIASRGDLTQVCQSEKPTPHLMRWQWELLGETPA